MLSCRVRGLLKGGDAHDWEVIKFQSDDDRQDEWDQYYGKIMFATPMPAPVAVHDLPAVIGSARGIDFMKCRLCGKHGTRGVFPPPWKSAVEFWQEGEE